MFKNHLLSTEGTESSSICDDDGCADDTDDDILGVGNDDVVGTASTTEVIGICGIAIVQGLLQFLLVITLV